MSRSVYTLLLYLVLPLLPFRLLWRSMRQPGYLHHLGERFGFFDIRADKPLIWLHCVSVGETRASEPLIRLLQQHYPDHDILLTHTTPTGRATSEKLFGNSVMRAYLPYDLPQSVTRFIRHFKPKLGLLMETELWFNLINVCKSNTIPLLLVNARLSERSARGYDLFLGRSVKQGLKSLTIIAAQSSSDAERLRALGAPSVVVTGNLKFDVVLPDSLIAQGLSMRQQLGQHRPILLAASTRDGEEALVLDAIKNTSVPELLTIIVPRHPQRFDKVAELLQRHGVIFQRRTENLILTADCQVLLGDSVGEMYAYYAACDLALIGGSLLPYGGQNLIEACVLGKPVLIGPHTFNFEQIASQAVSQGAAMRVCNSDAIAAAVSQLLKDKEMCKRMGQAGLAFSESGRGAVKKVFSLVTALI